MRTILPALLLICACGGSPIEGTWKSDYRVQGNAQDEFTLDQTDGDVTRGTSIVYDLTEGELTKCEGAATATKVKDKAYTLNLDPSGTSGPELCKMLADLEKDCVLSDDENTLDCEGLGKFLRSND
jgi:hypothetical protein